MCGPLTRIVRAPGGSSSSSPSSSSSASPARRTPGGRLASSRMRVAASSLKGSKRAQDRQEENEEKSPETRMPRSFLVKSKRAHTYHQPRALHDCTGKKKENIFDILNHLFPLRENGIRLLGTRFYFILNFKMWPAVLFFLLIVWLLNILVINGLRVCLRAPTTLKYEIVRISRLLKVVGGKPPNSLPISNQILALIDVHAYVQISPSVFDLSLWW